MISPKLLLKKLQSKTGSSKNIDFQVFLGIKNVNGINHDHHYCYAISFLQLFFHCPDVIQYFNKSVPKNSTERLLSKIFKELYKKNNYSAIDIINFILNWQGWNGGLLPNDNGDIIEFVNYLLNSVTQKLSDFFFLIEGEFYDTSIAPYDRNYFLTVLPNGRTIEDVLNNSMKKCKKITRYPKYLMISLSRNEIDNVNEQYIPINSFLKIGSIVYKHHATTVFNGKVAAGHYTSLIKIDDEYFQFNDEIVTALFYYERCPPTLRTFITEINNQMNRRGTLFLYIKSYENYVPNVYEQIVFQCPN